MRERLQAWADYFAAIGFALWVAAGVLFLLGNQPNERLIALAILGLAFVVLYVVTKFATVKQAVTSRSARYGSNALVITLAFIGIVALLNFMGMRYHYRQDVTANQTYTLSQKTRQVLQELKEPVKATAFYVTQGVDPTAQQQTLDRLKEYASVNSDKFTYKFIDPQAEPQIADAYKVQFDGTIVFERGTRRENVMQSDEQSLTNAIVKVSQDTQPTIYFTTGHGEHSPDDSADNGYSLMKTAMEAENYKVTLLDLKTLTSTLPSDIAALVIAGPRQPFDPKEVEIIKDYWNTKNGRMLVMLDPQVQTGLEDMLKVWGVNVRNDAVIDPKLGFFGQAQVPIINTYRSHPVTQDMTGQSSFFPGIRSLWTEQAPKPNLSVTPLFSTSDASWGETDFDSIKSQSPKLDEGKDAKGPLDLAYAVQGTGENPARLIVVGNSSFISNGTLNARVNVGGQQQRIQSGNALIFGNSLHWLAGQENLIAIPAKAPDSHPIFLTTEQANFVFWSSFLLIPGAILIIGALIWWRRR